MLMPLAYSSLLHLDCHLCGLEQCYQFLRCLVYHQLTETFSIIDEVVHLILVCIALEAMLGIDLVLLLSLILIHLLPLRCPQV